MKIRGKKSRETRKARKAVIKRKRWQEPDSADVITVNPMLYGRQQEARHAPR